MEMINIKELTEECLNCKNPTCIKGCPCQNNIPLFISLCKQEKYQEAMDVIYKTSTLPGICSMVCPSYMQCEASCIKSKMNKPVQIHKIENYIFEKCHNKSNSMIAKKNKRIAIVGSGPAGLASAEKLCDLGYFIDVYDRYDVAGGILTYGIPDFVLKKEIVQDKINYLIKQGVNFKLKTELEKDIKLLDLSKKYDAVLLAFGLSKPISLNIENENLSGIIDADILLENYYKKNYKILNNHHNAIVIGGGNTAIDAALILNKLNINTKIVYRRDIKHMPCRKDELQKVLDNKIEIITMRNPIQFIGQDSVEKMICCKTIIGENNKAVNLMNEIEEIKADLIIKAISNKVGTDLSKVIKCSSYGNIIVDENYQTSIQNVFACGDCVNGPSLVVKAMADAIKCCNFIHFYLNKESSL